MGVKNFGATSLTEVHEKLGGLGLSLRSIEEDGVPASPVSAPVSMDAAMGDAAETDDSSADSSGDSSSVTADADAGGGDDDGSQTIG